MSDTGDEQPLEDPWRDKLAEARGQLSEATDGYGAPEVLSLVAVTLAILALLGQGLLNGPLYADIAALSPPTRATRIAGEFLGALLAAVPLLLGLRVVGQRLAEDPRWVSTLARAAILLAGLAFVLRLVLLVLVAVRVQSDPTGTLLRGP